MSLFKKKPQSIINIVKIEDKYFSTEHNKFIDDKYVANESFYDVLLAETNGKKVYARGDRYNYTLYADDRPVLVAKNACAVEIDFRDTTELPSHFLSKNTTLKHMNTPNVRIIGDYCLFCNKAMRKLYLNNLEIMGDSFMYDNKYMLLFQAKKLQEMKRACFRNAKYISVDTPNIYIVMNHDSETLHENPEMRKKLFKLAEYNHETRYINSMLSSINKKRAM